MLSDKQSIIGRFEEIMRLLGRTFHDSRACYLNGLELTIQQFMVLNIVHSSAGPKMTDLASRLNVTLGNVTALVDRLIKLRYLRRRTDPADRRVVRVALTAQGRELITRAEEKRRKALELLLGHLSPGDRQQLLQIMEKLALAINTEGEISK